MSSSAGCGGGGGGVRRGRGAGGPSSGAAAGRVLAKLDAALNEKNFYEAHQMYRTLYFRHLGQKKYTELEDLLFSGASKLFAGGESGSGSDLAKLYVDVLEKGERKPAEEVFLRIAKLYSSIPSDNPDRESFLGSAIRWSSSDKLAGCSNGHPRLHQLFAYSMWSSKRYPESRHHFLYSCDGSGCGSMLVEFHVLRGFQHSEVDLFVAGTVLQFLCLRKHIVAALALRAYTEKHPSIATGPPYKHPLLNFVWLLLLAIEHRQSLTAYSVLVDKYKPSLLRDPAYLEYLDKIGQQFFGVPPPQRSRPGGMFAGLFDSLFNVLNDNEADEDASAVTSSDDGGSIRSLSAPNGGSLSAAATPPTTAASMETEDLD